MTKADILVGWRLRGAELTPSMNRQAKYGKLALPLDSHPISKLVSQFLDKTKYKKMLAANAAVVGVVFNVITGPSHAFDYQVTDRIAIEGSAGNTQMITESAYTYPVVSPTSVSQGYHAFHPGIDIRAPRGSGVVSVAEGVVIEAKYTGVGYGRYVRVAHQGTVSTLYAHLETIKVQVGQKISKGEEIGTVGSTGWSTGPHLHFEIYEGNMALSPSAVIGIR